MRLIFGLTGAFALGVSIFSKTGFPEPSSYVLSITDRDPRAPTKVQILANRLTGPDASALLPPCRMNFTTRRRRSSLCTLRSASHNAINYSNDYN